MVFFRGVRSAGVWAWELTTLPILFILKCQDLVWCSLAPVWSFFSRHAKGLLGFSAGPLEDTHVVRGFSLVMPQPLAQARPCAALRCPFELAFGVWVGLRNMPNASIRFEELLDHPGMHKKT